MEEQFPAWANRIEIRTLTTWMRLAQGNAGPLSNLCRGTGQAARYDGTENQGQAAATVRTRRVKTL